MDTIVRNEVLKQLICRWRRINCRPFEWKRRRVSAPSAYSSSSFSKSQSELRTGSDCADEHHRLGKH